MVSPCLYQQKYKLFFPIQFLAPVRFADQVYGCELRGDDQSKNCLSGARRLDEDAESVPFITIFARLVLHRHGCDCTECGLFYTECERAALLAPGNMATSNLYK
jgi:hypothetical protein